MQSEYQQHLFLVDVHLGAFDPDKESTILKHFCGIIDYAIQHKCRLYLLGDIFDYWMEYPKQNFVPGFGSRILEKLRLYNESIEPALFITGNHDNWDYGHFKTLGFDVERDCRIVSIGQKRLLLMHGDGELDENLIMSRPLFHRLLRNHTFVRLYQAVFPPETGNSIMKWFSNFTRKRNHIAPKPINEQAAFLLERDDIDVVITGHDHVARIGTFDGGLYLNPGPFYEHFSLIRYNEGEFNFVSWDAEIKDFVPFQPNRQTI